MTEQEVKEGNKQIKLYNKFCFMKKLLPKYKKIAPLKLVIIYGMISCVFLSLPTIFSEVGGHCYGSPEKCNTYPDRTREYRVKLINKILKDIDKLLKS